MKDFYNDIPKDYRPFITDVYYTIISKSNYLISNKLTREEWCRLESSTNLDCSITLVIGGDTVFTTIIYNGDVDFEDGVVRLAPQDQELLIHSYGLDKLKSIIDIAKKKLLTKYINNIED